MQSARYPGVRPFETFQKDFFFGRDRDVADLYDLVMLEKMVVLFGRSGYGKSSLINAGLIPRLQAKEAAPDKHYLPLVVRPGSYVEGQTILPLRDRLVRELAAKLPDTTAPFLDAFCEQKTLWYHFKQRQSPEHERFVLIFDQFEEFFTHPQGMQTQFNTELAELLYETIPQAVRRAARDAGEDQLTLLARPLDIKVLFAIRGDRLALLDRMKTQLPAIFNRRFDLKALSVEQARDAIVRPAILPKSIVRDGKKIEFTSPPFEYDKNALTQILQHLCGEPVAQEARVEAFQLQIVCTWIEDEVRAGRITDRDGNDLPDVLPEDLPDFSTIFETYYKQQIEKLPPEQQKVAREVIEEELLFVNPQSGEGRRLSVDKDLLLYEFGKKGLTEALLKSLEDTFLLRREANAMGGFSFEISHDALIDPIAKARAERLEEVERQLALERAEQERLEAEIRAREAEEKARAETERRTEAERLQREAQEQRQLAEQRQQEALEQKAAAETQRNLADKRRNFSRRVSFVAVVLALAAGGLGLWGWKSAVLAEERLILVEVANAERDLMAFSLLVNNGDVLFSGKYYQSALESYLSADTLSQKHTGNPRFQSVTQNLPDKIRQCQNALQNR